MKCDLAHASEVVECICRLHNVCLDQREPIKSVRLAKENDGCFRDVAETNGEARDTTEQRAADAKKGAQAVVRDPLVRRLKQQNQKRPRSSNYSYFDEHNAPSVAAHARAAMRGTALPADGATV